MNYRKDIDGLRAVSIIAVVIYHYFDEILPGGYIGVDIFFVISGYLITCKILNDKLDEKFSLTNFYSNRVKRILPPLITLLVFVGFFSYIFLPPNINIEIYKNIFGASIFATNFFLINEAGYFDIQSEYKPLLHLWSLAVEEQFYIVWPVIISIIFLCKVERLIYVIFLAIALASFSYSIYIINSSPLVGFYSPFPRAWELIMGGLLALNSVVNNKFLIKFQNFYKIILTQLPLIGLIIFTICIFKFSKTSNFPGWLVGLPVISACFIISSKNINFINNKFLSNWFMVKIGLISYEIYLYHWPFLILSKFYEDSYWNKFIAILAVILISYLTHIYINKKITQCKNIVFILMSLLFIAGLIGLLGYKEVIYKKNTGALININKANDFNRSIVPENSCVDIVDLDKIAFKFCKVWGDQKAVKTIVVWGDSFADAWMPPFIEASKLKGFRVIEFAHAACAPIIGVRRTDNSFSKEWCNDGVLQNQIFDTIKKIKPDKVFLIARWNLYYHGLVRNNNLIEKSFLTDEINSEASKETSLSVFNNSLPNTINSLAKFTEVIIMKDTPVLKMPMEIGINTNQNYQPTRAEYDAIEGPINKIIDKIISENYNTTRSFDPTLKLCNSYYCNSIINNLPIYYDDAHITAQASLLFSSEILKLIDYE
jgi:peptidoglycan/LPS O-acetylase OafA/YrhL